MAKVSEASVTGSVRGFMMAVLERVRGWVRAIPRIETREALERERAELKALAERAAELVRVKTLRDIETANKIDTYEYPDGPHDGFDTDERLERPTARSEEEAEFRAADERLEKRVRSREKNP